MDKRAISPLLSTLLLITFAVILGLAVMNWGRAQLENSAVCTVNTRMALIDIDNEKQICYSGIGATGFITFALDNGPVVDLVGLQVRIAGSKNIYNLPLQERVMRGFSVMKTIPYNFNMYGDIQEIKISPIIQLNSKPLICQEQAIIVKDIKQCKTVSAGSWFG